ncbi:YybH family protein [Microvirga sp. GCM10011540]|uniref:YybH family protein n=1 Tax=Microvirga sp. GCM10011540 TaxID=3317338 RepID=UPI00360E45EA
MDTAAYKVRSEDQVRDLLHSWLKAVRAKDVDAIASHYAPDIVAFDAIAQLQFKGVDAYSQHWKACMDMCEGAMTFEIHDLAIAAGEDVAFGHYLSRCGGADANGEEKFCWMRVSVGCRKKADQWTIVHEHFSAPFDMETGKVLFGLEP